MRQSLGAPNHHVKSACPSIKHFQYSTNERSNKMLEAKQGRICRLCGATYQKDLRFSLCLPCHTPEMSKEEKRVRSQIKRAQQAGVPATLTLPEWIVILNHFDWKCAYCREKKHRLMEHIISIKRGGGTTAYNCVPACPMCNRHKDCEVWEMSYNIMPDENIERVKNDLINLWSIDVRVL